MISRLRRVPLREVWAHEARDFTSWLAENLDVLEESTGLSLSLVEQEAPTGRFSVDILAEDRDGNLVVIENQLEPTNHDHLGKIITYMSNHDAKTALWIVAQARPEHVRAVQWLNEFLPANMSVYLIQVEAVRIDDSPPAPLFTVLAAPSEESREIGEKKKELAERHRLQLVFWKRLLERARKRTSLHARISPSKYNSIGAGAGKTGLQWLYEIRMEYARVELYIDTGDAQKNKEYVEFLKKHQEKIEETFGDALDFWTQEGVRATGVLYRIHGLGGLRDRDRWDTLQDAMIDAMIRLERALKPYIQQLP